MTALAQTNLADVYFRQRRLNEAEQLLGKAIETLEQRLGSENPHLVRLMMKKAEILKASGRKDEARRAEQRAREILAKTPRDPLAGQTVDYSTLPQRR